VLSLSILKDAHRTQLNTYACLESVAQHAASALTIALTFEKTKESAPHGSTTELPNARGLLHDAGTKAAECERLGRESLSVISMDVDDFQAINDVWTCDWGFGCWPASRA